jgi:hypothetical protein
MKIPIKIRQSNHLSLIEVIIFGVSSVNHQIIIQATLLFLLDFLRDDGFLT